MIGKLGPLPLAAVGSANQVFGIYSMILFGLFSGAAVPLAQYFGVRDFKSIRGIVSMDVILCLVMGIPTVQWLLQHLRLSLFSQMIRR